MSHNEEIKILLMTRPYVLISELRTKYDYRTRISELRKKNFNIKSIQVDVGYGKKAHAYTMVGKEIQKELFPAMAR